MKLYFSKASPFARKIQITAAVLGIQNKIEIIPTDVFNPPTGYQKINPLGPELWSALNIQAIADGATDACVARRWESHVRSPDKFDAKIDQRQVEKINNALEFFERNLFSFSKSELTIKEISLICFVDYINFRFAHEKMENQYPQIFSWVKKWNENPLVKESSPL